MRFPISPLIVYLILNVAFADNAAPEAGETEAPTPADLRQQALDALSSVNYEKALNIYSTLIELEPESPYNYFQRAFVRFTQKRFAKALPDLEAAIRIDDKHVQSKLYLGKCYHRMGNYGKAVANYKEVLDLSPSDADAKSALETLENVKYAEEKLESLLKDGNCGTHVQQLLSTVLSEAQYNTKLLFARAKCSFERGQYHDALLDTGSILKSNRNHLDTYLLRGQSYYQLDDLDTALTHYKEGLRLDPEHKPLKTAYKELKSLNKAIKKAEESVKKGKLHEGLRFYEDALKKETKHKKMRSRLLLSKCQVLVKLKKGIEAVRACSDALHLDPELVDAYGERGDAYLLNEMYEEAVRDWKKAVERSPQDGRLQNGLRNAEKQLKMSKRKDYYKILGISKNAGEREIKRAYKKAALQWHPDKWKTDEEKEIAEKKFYDINEANEVLKDPDLRRRYDAGEDVMDPGAKQQQGGFHGGFPNGFPFRFGGGGGGGPGGGSFSFKFGRG